MGESFPLVRCLDPEGGLVGPSPDLDRDALLRLYRTMMLVRALDARMLILQRQGRVGFYGTSTGQEAVPAGAAEALAPTDWVYPGLREGAIMLHRGYPLEKYLFQVFGRDADPSRGRQMPSHQADAEVCFASWSSCIGNQLPQAVGAALALRGDGVVLGCCGDGATSTGDFHVSLELARRTRAPVVFLVQNNHWSISIPTSGQTRASSLAAKGWAAGLPSARVDGNDALAVTIAVREAAEHARSGSGPCFLEMVTYRIGAHSSSDDPRVYRDEAEVEVWKGRDPIQRLRAHLEAEHAWTAADELALTTSLAAEIAAAVETAEAAPGPDLSSLTEDVLAP